jgi:hypothetical protein
MPRGPRSILVPQSLKDRCDLIKKKLRPLTDDRIILIDIRVGQSTKYYIPRVEIVGRVHVRNTDYYLDIWEDFRDFDIDPNLYGFKYALMSHPDPSSEPAFRYECHPDVADHPEEDDEAPEVAAVQQALAERDRKNPYETAPHFHPHTELIHPLSRLHFMFHRHERPNVIFSLIAWINRDLVKRFYDSGRVRRASEG